MPRLEDSPVPIDLARSRLARPQRVDIMPRVHMELDLLMKAPDGVVRGAIDVPLPEVRRF